MSRLAHFSLILAIVLGSAFSARADQNYLATPMNNEVPPPLGNTRDGRGEIFGIANYSPQDSSSVRGIDGFTHDSPRFQGGIAVGYNVGNHFNVNVDGTAGPARIKDIVFTNGQSTTFAQQNSWLARELINFEVYPLSGPITPIGTVGIGWVETISDSPNMPQLPNIHVHETDLDFAAGGGLRWDIDTHWSTKLMYKANWMKFQQYHDYLMFHTFYIAIGYRF